MWRIRSRSRVEWRKVSSTYYLPTLIRDGQLTNDRSPSMYSAVHCHMTNTRISDVEIMEKRYPIILRDFSIRKGSGGRGQYNGGDGVTRVIECREPLTFSMISERRVSRPYGLHGGEDGAPGENLILRKSGDQERLVSLGPRGIVKLQGGERFMIKTPGGGGWGSR